MKARVCQAFSYLITLLRSFFIPAYPYLFNFINHNTMASREPLEEEIDNLVEFCNLKGENDRVLARQALKLNNNNIEMVAGEFYNNGEDNFRSRYTKLWDDSAFSADRDGNSNNAGISFHVESSDHAVIQGVTPPPDSHMFGAPSRPPSRSNNRSPLGTMVEWTAAHAPGISLSQSDEHLLTRSYKGVPNSQAQEDDDVQRAIRESAQEAGITIPEQETGFIGPSEPAPTQFGPANRETYEESQWAMVPVGPASKEISTNDPKPSERKRIQNAPVMLIKSRLGEHDHRLGSLLTIMHEIPMVRNILLNIGNLATTYGNNKDWWKGEEILSQEVLAKMNEEMTWEAGEHNSNTAFEEEIHRLMAFLDSTERAYGSISMLTELMKFHGIGTEKHFYEMLQDRHGEAIRPLTQVATVAPFHGGAMEENVNFGYLEIEHSRNEYKCIKTLYEALDHVMWSDALGPEAIQEDSKVAFFKEMGDVLVLDISGDGPKDSIEIPHEFYPEKYLVSRQDEARRIQYGWRQTKEDMARLEREKEQLDQLKGIWATGNINTKSGLLKKSVEQWEGYKSYLDGFRKFTALMNSGFNTDKYPDYREAAPHRDDEQKKRCETVEQVIEYSKTLLESLENRMKDLDTEMEQVVKKQRALGRLLTVPDKPGRPKPMTCKKYLLRGVATSSDVVYVCQREEEDLIELNSESNRVDQWWRLAYNSHGDGSTTRVEKIKTEELFEDVWHETRKPLLVYATEEALGTSKQRLPPQLELFVKVDNKAFRQELTEEETTAEVKQTPNSDHPLSPLSPSKRKHRADSVGSMDSNRASIGSDGRNGFDSPFDFPDDHTGTEMQDYGGSSNYIHSSDILDDPPDLPARPQGSTTSTTEPTSATMTPNTVEADYVDSEEPRSPEMQEKSRPPPFMSISRTPSERKEPINLMDMDIPDEKQ